jgi:hypothetical protein
VTRTLASHVFSVLRGEVRLPVRSGVHLGVEGERVARTSRAAPLRIERRTYPQIRTVLAWEFYGVTLTSARAILRSRMFRSRSRPRGGHDARFLWQVLLVVPPVVILSVVALYSLRQDRASIEQDARKNAGVLAAELARRFGERIHDDLAAAAAAQIAGSVVPASAARGLNGARAETAPAADTAALQPLCGLILNGRIRLPLDYPALPSPPVVV